MKKKRELKKLLADNLCLRIKKHLRNLLKDKEGKKGMVFLLELGKKNDRKYIYIMCCGMNTRSFSNYSRNAPRNFVFSMYGGRCRGFFYNRRGRR